MKPVDSWPARQRGCCIRPTTADVVADALDGEGVERMRLGGDRLVAAPGMGDQLGDHRIVVERDLAALVDAGVVARRDSRLLQEDAVDDGFDGVVFAPVEEEGLGEVVEFAVDAGAKPLLIKLIEQLLKPPFGLERWAP